MSDIITIDTTNGGFKQEQNTHEIYKLEHKCLKHGDKLFHRSNKPKAHHSFIYPCDKCNGENFETRN